MILRSSMVDFVNRIEVCARRGGTKSPPRPNFTELIIVLNIFCFHTIPAITLIAFSK